MMDYRIDFRVRNNRIVRRMEERGWCNADLARATGLSQSVIGELVNLKRAPLRPDNSVKPEVDLVCLALEATVEDLWPPHHLETPLQRNRAQTEMSFDEVRHLLEGSAEYAVPALENAAEHRSMARAGLSANLTDRERRVLTMTFGLDGKPPKTFGEIAKLEGVTHERIRQIELRAIRKAKAKLRRDHPWLDEPGAESWVA